MEFWEGQKSIMTLYTSYTKPICEQYHLTQMEFNIIMFFYNNPEYYTAADIIRIKNFSKSHVSTALKDLEKKHYIKKEHIDHNQKSYKITITEKSKPIIEEGTIARKSFFKHLFKDFSEKELVLFKEFSQRIYQNSIESFTI